MKEMQGVRQKIRTLIMYGRELLTFRKSIIPPVLTKGFTRNKKGTQEPPRVPTT